jgi:hypothetical protein
MSSIRSPGPVPFAVPPSVGTQDDQGDGQSHQGKEGKAGSR